MQSCVGVMETPHSIDSVDVTWLWVTNRGVQHSITAIGVGICKVKPLLPDVSEQSSLYSIKLEIEKLNKIIKVNVFC